MAVSGSDLVEKFFTGTGHNYDRVVRVCTLGLDARWKRRLLSKIPRTPKAVLDLACGTGIVTFELLRIFPGVRVVGVDITENYLAVARAKHRQLGGDARFLLGNAETTPVTDQGPFDAVVSSYIPKYVDADRLLANVTPALRPGGVIALHDFTYPRAFVQKTIWNGYLAVLDPAARRIFPNWDNVFDASLTELIRTSPWVRQFRAALPRHGYEDVQVDGLTWRSATIVSARKRS